MNWYPIDDVLGKIRVRILECSGMASSDSPCLNRTNERHPKSVSVMRVQRALDSDVRSVSRAEPAYWDTGRWSTAIAGTLLCLVTIASMISCGWGVDEPTGSPFYAPVINDVSSPEVYPWTIEEYAQQLCPRGRITDYDTVAEMVDAATQGLARQRRVNPPYDLRDFHEFSILYLEELLELSESVRGGRKPIHSTFIDIGEQDLFGFRIASWLLFSATRGLDSDVRETFQRHDCIGNASIDGEQTRNSPNMIFVNFESQ